MGQLAPQIDRLACIGHDVSLAAPEEKLRTFVDRADTFGKLVRKGFFNAAALEQKLWDVARAYGLSGSPGSESEEYVSGVIESAVALTDEAGPHGPNGHDREDEATSAPGQRKRAAVAPKANNSSNKPSPIVATPYVWKDPAKIPLRDWLYGHLIIREIVTATVSPGAVGKSSLITADVLAMVSGKDLIGTLPKKQLRVWLWNLEDPQEETDRKIQAAALHCRLSPDDIGDRLFVDSGRDQPLVVATTTRTGAMISRPVIDALVDEIIARKIDVLVIDPFVSCHEVPENDNTAMDMIVKEWGKVADRGKCGVHLVDHTRKMGGAETEVTVESSRGGKAKTDGCRGVRVVNRMTKEEGGKAGVENHRLYFRTYDDKPNLTPPADTSDWFKLKSVSLGNGPNGGDSVGVVTK
jgi:hypothetical protein